MPFFLFSLITMMFSVTDPFFFTSVQKTISYFLSLLVIPNLFLRIYREKGEVFLKNILLFLLFTLVLGILLRFISYELVYIESGRFRGVLGNPNGLGIYCMLIFIFFTIITRRFPEMFSRIDKLIYLGFIFLSIILTDSRNAVLGVVIFLVFHRFFKISPFLGLIFFLLFVTLAEAISNNLSTIITSLGLGEFFRVETLEEGSGRYIAWEFAWLQIQENFFIGKGFAYNEYYMRQHYALLNKLGHQGGIHNSFLTFWMDQGLIGLLIYLRSFLLVFVQGSRWSSYAFPAMFAIAFTAIFESWLVGSLSAFAFLAMLIYTVLTSEELIVDTEVKEKTELIPELAS
jgi:O-antigen ligase